MPFAYFIPEIFVGYLIKALISEERPNVQNREGYGDWHLVSTDMLKPIELSLF